jgi:uncharacterized protein
MNIMKRLALAGLVSAIAGSAAAQSAPAAGPALFLCRLIPARSTFPGDMTPGEAAIMKRHVAYWTGESRKGQILLFGPVADPKGGWGVLIIRAAAASEVTAETRRDPAITELGMHYEILPMPMALVPPEFGAARP